MSDLLYSAAFFGLQIEFAKRVAEVAGTPLSVTVGKYTNIYVRLAFGPRLDAQNPDWVRFAENISTSSEPAHLAYVIQQQRAHLLLGFKTIASVGCFSLSPIDEISMRIHFRPERPQAESPLAQSQQATRRQELSKLLAAFRACGGRQRFLVGASWLYNLEAYRDLFPLAYCAALRPVAHPYERMPLWGQFLNRYGGVRTEAARRFLAQIKDASNIEDLAACFPLKVLAARVPIECLYEHFA